MRFGLSEALQAVRLAHVRAALTSDSKATLTQGGTLPVFELPLHSAVRAPPAEAVPLLPCPLLPCPCPATDIKPGMGLYYSSLSGEYRGVNCDQNGYGVANTTYGRAPRPCRRCHPGMTASDALPTSAAYLSLDDSVPPLGGFTSALACVTKPGHGYNGWYGPPCPPGSYNSGGNYEECTECPTGGAGPRRLCCVTCQVQPPALVQH